MVTSDEDRESNCCRALLAGLPRNTWVDLRIKYDAGLGWSPAAKFLQCAWKGSDKACDDKGERLLLLPCKARHLLSQGVQFRNLKTTAFI